MMRSSVQFRSVLSQPFHCRSLGAPFCHERKNPKGPSAPGLHSVQVGIEAGRGAKCWRPDTQALKRKNSINNK